MRRMTEIERYDCKWVPEPNSGCWLWTHGVTRQGYGKFQVSRRKSALAHRAGWNLRRGEVPDGMYLDHKCRTRSCVNPDHLRVVTPRVNSLENSMSVAAVNAARTACACCGGRLTSVREGARATRRCLKCRRVKANARQRAYRDSDDFRRKKREYTRLYRQRQRGLWASHHSRDEAAA